MEALEKKRFLRLTEGAPALDGRGIEWFSSSGLQPHRLMPCYNARPMSDFLGFPRSRLPIAIAMVIALAAGISWLQGRFDTSDVKTAITMTMAYRPTPNAPTLFDALANRNEGDPRCDGEVISTFFGDVKVRCSTPKKPEITYDFRVLLDGKRQPRPDNEPARVLLSAIANGPPR